MLADDRIPVVQDGRQTLLHTFAGGRINNTLGRVIEALSDLRTSVGNFTVAVKRAGQGAVGTDEVMPLLAEIRSGSALHPSVRRSCVTNLPRYRLSKFQQYLPPDLEAEFLAERLLDFEGMVALLAEGR